MATWIAVKDDTDAEHNWTYDHQPMVGGPFSTVDEANDWIGDDDRLIAIRR